ncbi:MAG: 30S ribosomal protein S16 [Puniceicoccales bacterium]|jgi:small subunit ribosomal protein S16|nr:30S ribosomal protein S16 [Puniceicoccales bacterium]
MALKIRLQRRGNRNRPVYKIVIAESTSRRDGRFVEAIGNYDPNARGNSTELAMLLDRADYWISVGAKPTDTVKSLIKRARRSLLTA